MKGEEKRRQIRVFTSIPITFHMEKASGEMNGNMVDISLSGLRFTSREKLTIGDIVKMKFVLPNDLGSESLMQLAAQAGILNLANTLNLLLGLLAAGALGLQLRWNPQRAAASPHESGTLYAGTKPAGVFVIRDAGLRWTELESFRQIRGYRFWRSPAEPPDWRAYVQALTLSPTDPGRDPDRTSRRR